MNRDTAPDVLRGFALLGILVVNSWLWIASKVHEVNGCQEVLMERRDF
jgi:uncharacterized membrane protein YeiB